MHGAFGSWILLDAGKENHERSWIRANMVFFGDVAVCFFFSFSKLKGSSNRCRKTSPYLSPHMSLKPGDSAVACPRTKAGENGGGTRDLSITPVGRGLDLAVEQYFQMSHFLCPPLAMGH